MTVIDAAWFSKIVRPSRYIAGEVNAVRKDPASVDVSVALAFPDVYEVGMSHLGLKILYHILNSRSWIAAERVFAPWTDLDSELKRRNLPLTALESDRPVSQFDIVGFSLQHELCYTNVLNMLDLAGIPLHASERDGPAPLIVAGGPACFNPEPMAAFVDVFVVGDGEEVFLEICRIVRDSGKGHPSGRRELLQRLRRLKGVYIPSFFSVQYRTDGGMDAVVPVYPDYPFVEKAVLADLADSPFPSRQVVPFTELVHDRIAIEISRGCTRGCRFCQAGIIYRPVRERPPHSILDTAEEALCLTGYDELGLLSLSSGDYTCIEPLIKTLMDRLSADGVAVSLPSLRADSLSSSLIEQVRRVRKTGFTLAPEAGSDRLRNIINKGITEEEIMETARRVYDAGWTLLKLYFMVGLPMEQPEDIQEIVRLAKRVSRLSGKGGRRPNLNIGVATFVPKAHTPFMWSPQIPLEESRTRIRLVQEGLRSSRVHVKWNQPELSWLEGILARGDRRLGPVILEAWRRGARFDAWDEHFRVEIWKEALSRCGVEPRYYLDGPGSPDEILPWDHIRTGVSKKFLRAEWERAQKGLLTPDCRETCLECGVCDHRHLDPVLFRGNPAIPDQASKNKEPGPSSQSRLRLTFTKVDRARHLSHLELARVFLRALKRAGVRLVYSKGFHPMPRLSFANALPVGVESLQETADIEIRRGTDDRKVAETINRHLPSGIRVTSVETVAPGKKTPKLVESHFIITLDGIELNPDDLRRFMASAVFPVKKVTQKGEKVVDARELVKSASLDPPNEVTLVMRHSTGPEIKPADVVKAIFALGEVQTSNMRILKIRQVVE